MGSRFVARATGQERSMANGIHANGAPKPVRFAIYTSNPTGEGLNQNINSLSAQRDAGEGWTLVPDQYEEGGYTGANMDRPTLRDVRLGHTEVQHDCVARPPHVEHPSLLRAIQASDHRLALPDGTTADRSGTVSFGHRACPSIVIRPPVSILASTGESILASVKALAGFENDPRRTGGPQPAGFEVVGHRA
jgi:hypothetical protein